jgi:hypothetical protein
VKVTCPVTSGLRAGHASASGVYWVWIHDKRIDKEVHPTMTVPMPQRKRHTIGREKEKEDWSGRDGDRDKEKGILIYNFYKEKLCYVISRGKCDVICKPGV